jgi:hypothetical protein
VQHKLINLPLKDIQSPLARLNLTIIDPQEKRDLVPVIHLKNIRKTNHQKVPRKLKKLPQRLFNLNLKPILKIWISRIN